ncbi:MAG: tRNA 2-thiouridine(34) synthase MnmA [Candidatus Neomarinimicrobiota bacterium]
MPKRVLVALSGGVDSSVALLKVLEACYEAVGVTMQLWAYRDTNGNQPADNRCCPEKAVNAARELCASLGMPHHLLDFQDVFRTAVVDDFITEYLQGRTPNPCVRCNRYVKWAALLAQADQLGADLIATGHYARIETGPDGQPQLLKGVDSAKEQSYFLWGIPRQALARTLLPLGTMTKVQARRIARDHRLATAQAPESQEICFLPDNDYRRFLQEQAMDQLAKVSEGEIMDEAGRVLGRHRGYVYYTIGQRRGLGIAHKEPLYVKSMDPATNRITVATRPALFQSACEVEQLNWLVDPLATPRLVQARLRYNSPAAPAKLTPQGTTARLVFDEPQLAITPGQSAAFYDGEILIGGGIISRALDA